MLWKFPHDFSVHVEMSCVSAFHLTVNKFGQVAVSTSQVIVVGCPSLTGEQPGRMKSRRTRVKAVILHGCQDNYALIQQQ